MGMIIAAAITTLAVAAFYGAVIVSMTAREDRRVVLLAALVALPLQPLVFYLLPTGVKFGTGPVMVAISLLYPPLTQELAKWLTLAVPAIRRRLNPSNAVALALAVGLGFGIGELWFVAYQWASIPAAAALPFYTHSGFFSEHVQACFLHGAFIAFAFQRLAERRSFLVGGIIGIVLHYTLDLPAIFTLADLFGIGRAWAALGQLWPQVLTMALVVALILLARRKPGVDAPPAPT